MSLLDVHDNYFLILPFEYDNISNGKFPNEFWNISSRNINAMATLLTSPNHRYVRCVLNISAVVLGQNLNDIVSTYVHPYSHTSYVTLTWGHFLVAILNGETIDLDDMIYMTIIFCYFDTTYFTLHYSYLIIYRGEAIFGTLPIPCLVYQWCLPKSTLFLVVPSLCKTLILITLLLKVP